MTRPDWYAGTFLREIAMDFSLGLFKDAADGIDKLADTIAKLGKMLASAIGGGYELMKWSEARETRKKLTSICAGALNIWQGQTVVLVQSRAEGQR
jgi:hypothetical protein